MEVKNIEINDTFQTASFEIDGLNYEKAKKIREFLLDIKPVVCVDIVCFSENTTSMEDEILSHRLGMLVCVEDSFPEDFENFPSREHIAFFKLLNSPQRKMIYSTDLDQTISDNPIFLKAPLLQIDKGESLDFYVTFLRQTRENHAKFSPLNVVRYVNLSKEKETIESSHPYKFWIDGNGGLDIREIVNILQGQIDTLF